MVIFTMNITSNRAPKGYKARAWRYWQKPTLGNKDIENLIERYARIASQYPSLWIKLLKILQTILIFRCNSLKIHLCCQVLNKL